MYTCIIIDDEPHAIEGLQRYIGAFPLLNFVSAYYDSLTALNEIQKLPPVDLILLDIDMPGINGIELFKELRGYARKIVFTTGHTKYGYEAFKLNADDYLLKPYTLGEFIISMNKLFQGKEEKEPIPNNFFFVKSKEDNSKLVSIHFADVIAVESKRNYVLIHTTKKNILTYMSLSEISSILKKHTGFVQYQRSFIISESYIMSIDGNTIKMTDGTQIVVGEYYRKDFADFISRKIIKSGKR
ncbi:response regulator transcription factor [Pedobacter frigidisoli]|uniref:Response regulator transcription factor n=1 Tax=Pedobacter frigidisoli TaxID=2530455 RepID=A0A4R0P7I9_9SPHI|nr:LytTR family DNA-binding domain-containing protein [Pedobacter frigidisoli]TCD13001.1 response regulator transcription factor [Pedobacter frigidisoli]